MEETALPAVGADAPAEASTLQDAEQAAKTPQEGDKPDEPKQPEKTPEQREIERMRRGLDRKVRQREEARAEAAALRAELERLKRSEVSAYTPGEAPDSEPLTLTRAQLQEMVAAEAKKLAPTLKEQAAEADRRRSVVSSLAKTWGQERFDELSSDLDEAFGGLTDREGRMKPAMEAVFEADEPARVIEYLANPDNADEAERISKLSPVQAGKAIARLELKLAEQAAKAKPQASKAAAPIEPVRAQGAAVNADPSTMTDEQFAAWRRRQIAQRR